MSVTAKLNIEKFSGHAEDFPDWRILFQNYIRIKKLANFLRPNYTRPRDAGQDRDDWDEGNSTLYAYLCMLTDDKTRREISSKFEESEDGQTAWKMVLERFERDKWNRFDELLRVVENLKMDEDADVSEYLGELELLCEKIKTINPRYMSDFIKLRYLLRGLPDYFEHYAGPMYPQNPDDPIDLPDIYKKLKGIHAYHCSRSNKATGLNVVSNKNKVFSKTKQQQEKQLSKEQKEQKPAAKKTGQKEKRRCFKCGEIGHLKKDCAEWKKRVEAAKKRQSAHIVEEEYEDDDEIMVITEDDSSSISMEHALVVSNSTIKFKVDSGATCHYCNDEKAFITLNKPSYPMTVTVANCQSEEWPSWDTKRISKMRTAASSSSTPSQPVWYIYLSSTICMSSPPS